MKTIPLGTGKVSWFGGPADTGVGPQEALSAIDPADLNEWWFRRIFLSAGRYDNGKGLARNLDPNAYYCAMRFAYGSFAGVPGEILPGLTREQVRRGIFLVEANGKAVPAQAADWGPNTDTGRLIDCSPGLLKALGLTTDGEANVTFVG